MDRTLDEILAERRQTNKRSGSRSNRGGNAGRRRERQDYPRDGVRKSFRDDAPRSLDSEWVHDKFDENDGRRSSVPRRGGRSDPSGDSRGTKIRVDNIHYELTEEDLDGLFNRIGPVSKLELRYDRAGRSEGTAFVTYESHHDAVKAIREFDGANAAGQPIHLTLLPSGPSGGARRNPFENAVLPGRPLAERISYPSERARSLSPAGGGGRRRRGRAGADSYRPGDDGSRSRTPPPAGNGGRRREGGGRRPGARRDAGGAGEKGGGASRGGARQGRPKKTQEELDAEMEDYFGGGGGGGGSSEGAGAAPAAAAAGNGVSGGDPVAETTMTEDIDMIE